MKDRIGLPRGAVLICVTPAGPVGEGTPSASGYHLSAQWRAVASVVWKQARKCSCCGIAPHQKHCFAFLSKHVLWQTENLKHTGSGDDFLCVWPFTHNERTHCEHQFLATYNLFAEGWDRRIVACVVGYLVGDGQYVFRCCERLWQSTV